MIYLLVGAILCIFSHNITMLLGNLQAILPRMTDAHRTVQNNKVLVLTVRQHLPYFSLFVSVM